MGQGIGKIQRRILEVLGTIDERYITPENRPLRWVWMNILVIRVYNPQQIEGKKEGWDWSYGKNHHRRIWESARMLEKRGLVQTRIIKVKEAGLKTKFGGCQRWLEVRVV